MSRGVIAKYTFVDSQGTPSVAVAAEQEEKLQRKSTNTGEQKDTFAKEIN